MTILKVGHRGAKAYAPENTIQSFKKAVELGADAIEFDVRQTKDKKPIVIHDKKIKGRKVSSLTLKQIHRINSKIPTLQETLDFAKKNKIIGFLEIKEKNACEKSAKLVKNKNLKIKIISYDTDVLKQTAKLAKNIETGLVFSDKIKNEKSFFRLCRACSAKWLVGELKTLSREFVKKAHKKDFKVFAWLVNNKKTAKKYAKMNVDAIGSDKPEILKGL